MSHQHFQHDKTSYPHLFSKYRKQYSNTYTFLNVICTPNIHGNTSYINSIWIDNLIKDLQHHTIKLKLRDTVTLIPDRYNDTNVMQDVNKQYTSIKTRTKFSAFQIYLRVICVSDICNFEGVSLNTTLLNNKENNRVNSRFWCLHQQKLGTKYWIDWFSYLLQVYCVPNSYHLQKQYHLGKWLTAYNIRNSHININFSPSLQEFYYTDKTTQQYYRTTGEGTYSIIPNNSDNPDIIYAVVIPIIIKNNSFTCKNIILPELHQ